MNEWVVSKIAFDKARADGLDTKAAFYAARDARNALDSAA
jgi:hypothetical protein